MGNKLGAELKTASFMLDAIRADSEERVTRAFNTAKSSRLMSKEDIVKQNISSEELQEMRQKAILEYLERKYNCEGTYFKGNSNKMTFIEFCYTLGFTNRARQIQTFLNDHRKSMGLEIDPVNLKAMATGAVPRNAGTSGLSETGKEAKGNLEAWLAKRNAEKQGASSIAVMNKLKDTK